MEGFVLPGTFLNFSMFYMKQYKHNQYFANIGQNIACRYLKSKKYFIISQNFRIGPDEIDIIAIENKEICFIEIKTRLSSRYDKAEYHISARKLKYMIRSSQRFCEEWRIPEKLIRLEAIAVTLHVPNKKANIKHFIRII